MQKLKIKPFITTFAHIRTIRASVNESSFYNPPQTIRGISRNKTVSHFFKRISKVTHEVLTFRV